MVHNRCLLASLPHELLLYQLAFFQDLHSHLTFSLTCRRIHVLYDEHLWRKISISFGLGKPFDLTCGEVSWRRVCATAVAHGRICRLRDCSEAALSKGKLIMLPDLQANHPRAGRDTGLSAPPSNFVFYHHRIHAEGIELHLSPIFEGLNGDLEDFYSSSIPCDSKARPWRFKHLFQKPEYDLLESIAIPATHTSEQMVTKLAHHFPASCALATVPAVDRLDLDIGQRTVHVRNKDGVCVWDVVSAIARK